MPAASDALSALEERSFEGDREPVAQPPRGDAEVRMGRKLYSPRQLAVFAQHSLAQLEYLSEIGLLLPCTRTRDGQLRYDDEALLRLHQIRMGRARGLALEEIRRWLDACAHGFGEHGGPPIPCGNVRNALYVQTDVKVETDADRVAFQREAGALYAALSARRSAGVTPADPELEAWAEWHCCHINRWFRACDPHEHIAFGRAIADSPYHSASIERHGQGLSSFMLSVLEAHTR